MSAVMMKVLQQQVESLTRQVEQLGPENERVRKLLTEFDERHDRDQARVEALEAENARLREAIWDACCVLEQITFSDLRQNPAATLEAIEKVDGDLSAAHGPNKDAAP